MNLSDASAIYIGSQAASAVYITDGAGTATQVWPTAAPSIYPVNGAWGPLTPGFAYGVLDSHTIAEDGTYTVSHTVTRVDSEGNIQSHLDGDTGFQSGPRTAPASTCTWTGPLAVGNVVQMKAWGVVNAVGAWTITKH